jgi:hypothetical protein
VVRVLRQLKQYFADLLLIFLSGAFASIFELYRPVGLLSAALGAVIGAVIGFIVIHFARRVGVPQRCLSLTIDGVFFSISAIVIAGIPLFISYRFLSTFGVTPGSFIASGDHDAAIIYLLMWIVIAFWAYVISVIIIGIVVYIGKVAVEKLRQWRG